MKSVRQKLYNHNLMKILAKSSKPTYETSCLKQRLPPPPHAPNEISCNDCSAIFRCQSFPLSGIHFSDDVLLTFVPLFQLLRAHTPVCCASSHKESQSFADFGTKLEQTHAKLSRMLTYVRG